ncbi:MAG: hypothetical protein U9Q82_13635 [Chloroflexota bacterium]|nr:hypothetical protein [Chloroflexota bacterium]
MTNDRLLLTELPYNLPGSLYRSPMPFGIYDPAGEVWPAYQQHNVGLVVVLTEPQEYLVHACRDLPALYRSAGLDVIALPIPDFSTPPDRVAFNVAISNVEDALQIGQNVAVHCLAGVGRTGIFAACLAKRLLGMGGNEAVAWVRQHVPEALEGARQEQFVIDFACDWDKTTNKKHVPEHSTGACVSLTE